MNEQNALDKLRSPKVELEEGLLSKEEHDMILSEVGAIHQTGDVSNPPMGWAGGHSIGHNISL